MVSVVELKDPHQVLYRSTPRVQNNHHLTAIPNAETFLGMLRCQRRAEVIKTFC